MSKARSRKQILLDAIEVQKENITATQINADVWDLTPDGEPVFDNQGQPSKADVEKDKALKAKEIHEKRLERLEKLLAEEK